MKRGSTPTNEFEVDVDLQTAEAIYITYKQFGNTVIEKNIDDITIIPGNEETPEILRVKLTQTETLKFKIGDVYMQIRVRFPDGEALVSDEMIAPVERVLKEGVI